MRSLDEKLGGVSNEPHDFVCECGNEACIDRIPLTVAEYERIHADGARFVLVPGHEESDVEDVLEHRGTYTVVRKHQDGPAQIAEEHAPPRTEG